MDIPHRSFDPVATLVGWLDAYRAKDIDALLDFYAQDAVLDCGCDGSLTIVGNAALHAHWKDQVDRRPAGALEEVKCVHQATGISFTTAGGPLCMIAEFDDDGKIIRSRCERGCS